MSKSGNKKLCVPSMEDFDFFWHQISEIGLLKLVPILKFRNKPDYQIERNLIAFHVCFWIHSSFLQHKRITLLVSSCLPYIWHTLGLRFTNVAFDIGSNVFLRFSTTCWRDASWRTIVLIVMAIKHWSVKPISRLQDHENPFLVRAILPIFPKFWCEKTFCIPWTV